MCDSLFNLQIGTKKGKCPVDKYWKFKCGENCIENKVINQEKNQEMTIDNKLSSFAPVWAPVKLDSVLLLMMLL